MKGKISRREEKKQHDSLAVKHYLDFSFVFSALVEEEQEDKEEADDENNNEEESHHISSIFTIQKIDEILHILATISTSPPQKRGPHFSPFDLSMDGSQSSLPRPSMTPTRSDRLIAFTQTQSNDSYW
jgi:hypothetical protein